MKRQLLNLAALTLILSVSACTKENLVEPDGTQPEQMEFLAEASMTKTTLVEGTKVYFCPGDKISVQGTEYSTAITENAAQASFTGNAVTPIEGFFYAAYPAQGAQWTGTEVTMTLPANQPVVKGTFANGANLSVAKTAELEKTLSFKNVHSYLKLTVAEGDAAFQSVKITAAGAENIAGTIKVNAADNTFTVTEGVSSVTLTSAENFAAGDYYIGVLPGTLAQGLTFEFINAEGKKGTAAIARELKLQRSIIHEIPALEITWEGEAKITSFEEVRALTPSAIADNVLIEGIIVSNKESMNVAHNPIQMTVKTGSGGKKYTEASIDYTGNDNAAYVESLDGNYGFLLRTATTEDNTFVYGEKVQLNLNGATLVKNTNPERYELTGITASMVLAHETASVPVKEKYIGELTDADLYTYVTLKDCELPVRKGSLTPINEGYGPLFNADRQVKYPFLVRDIQGNDIYMYTNLKCPYRRDGKKLPYGQGTVSGVIVNEVCETAEYGAKAPTMKFGTLGKYQIRHQAYSDLNLADDIDNSFSAILTEFRYRKAAGNNLVPTSGAEALLSKTDGEKLDQIKSMCYLGPCGTSDTANDSGCGIIENGKDFPENSTNLNTEGKGMAYYKNDLAWCSKAWNKGEAWILKFSTEGITTNVLSMQFTAMSDKAGGPSEWDLDWSVNGKDGWLPIGDFYIPDFVNWGSESVWMAAGYKMFNVQLPLEMLGQKEVYIRFKPNGVSNKTSVSFGGGYLYNNIYAEMDYLAIRYNK